MRAESSEHITVHDYIASRSIGKFVATNFWQRLRVSSEHIAVYEYLASGSIGKLVATIFCKWETESSLHIVVYDNIASRRFGELVATTFLQGVRVSSEHIAVYVYCTSPAEVLANFLPQHFDKEWKLAVSILQLYNYIASRSIGKFVATTFWQGVRAISEQWQYITTLPAEVLANLLPQPFVKEC
jgi:hypothetical protein